MPKAALRNAATNAKPVAIRPSAVIARGETDGADDGEDEADQLGELQRRHRLTLGDRSEPRSDERGEHPAVGMLARTAARTDGEHHGLQTPRMTAAAASADRSRPAA